MLVDAAARAPTRPSTYAFIGEGSELIYVGTAVDLRRRLAGHARSRPGTDRRSDARIDLVRHVGWEEQASEEDALLREADLIAALRPPFNAAHTIGQHWSYISVTDADGPTTLSLSSSPAHGNRTYGLVPHLAKGGSSTPATWMKAGWTATLRLLWSTQATTTAAQIPKALGGASPPASIAIHVDPPLAAALDRYLHGRSPRLLDDLAERLDAADLPPHTRSALRRDMTGARTFYELGTRRMARFRRAHDLPPAALDPEQWASTLLTELRQSLDLPDLTVRSTDPDRPRRGPASQP